MLVSHEEYVYVYSMCMCMQRDTCIGSGEMVALTSSGISNAFAFLMNCFVFFSLRFWRFYSLVFIFKMAKFFLSDYGLPYTRKFSRC